MEFIKKKILRKTKITHVVSSTGNTYQILPDYSANYVLKLCLTAEMHDLGIFDSGIGSYGGYYGYYGYYGVNGDQLVSIYYPIGLDNLL